MKILLIMDPGIAVPPPNYGGHERLVYMFAEEYIKLGHEVTLLAGPNSVISGKVYTFGVNNLQRSKWQKTKELLFVWKFLYQKRKQFDLIHNFGRLAYLIPILNGSVKKIMTYGRPVAQAGIKNITAMANQHLIFTACSNYCVGTGNVAGRWETVYNAIDFSKYKLQKNVEANAPLMFLGRLDKIKGLHTAIQVAKATDNKLWIGGNIPDTADNYQYYKETLEPQFDGEQIIYLGALNDEQKNHYLGKAKALLFPIEWDEPFGMVMVEAMACGTPVIGFRRGSVPEVIANGKNGFIVKNKEAMIQSLQEITTIDRTACRAFAFEKFDVSIIAKQYLNL
ncbi:Glycosyltransferase involved in cell wall bisynthesis [Pedobacter terrae]|uniref:Glycosyltransferase involved in cell wall bisynthesis n=1 Tax=Pedobacter terrae TaxID=405671 RepID=A0A1G7U3T6_9SPHI|nr:glycosyltransferase family 4 protein [Pedobacter terrae]SDG42236.1 Glycosyltransferase involved in cell wall bisynthesis [Pedobacter terrae]